MLRPVAIALVIAGITTAAGAEPLLWRRLGAAEIARRFVGTTYEGVYPNGIRFSETIRADNTLDYDADDGANGGRFFLRGDEMCFSYTGEQRPYCFVVWQRSANCYDGYVDRVAPEGRTGFVAQMLGLGYDVRFWSAGEPTTCPAQATS